MFCKKVKEILNLTEMSVGSKETIVVEGEKCKYFGEKKNNKAHGEGIATLERDKDRSYYKGTFCDDELHGIGEFTNSLLIFCSRLY